MKEREKKGRAARVEAVDFVAAPLVTRGGGRGERRGGDRRPRGDRRGDRKEPQVNIKPTWTRNLTAFLGEGARPHRRRIPFARINVSVNYSK